jgi:hypothetical protein
LLLVGLSPRLSRHQGQVQKELLLCERRARGWRRRVAQASIRPGCRLGRVAAAMSAREVVEVAVTADLGASAGSTASALALRAVAVSLGHVVA